MIQRTEDKKKSGIYKIINTENNKVYIGKALDIYRRIKAHVTALNTRDTNENRHLINSWHKYGRKCFTYEVVEYIEDVNKIAERELYWMDYFDSLSRDKGYNMRYDSATGLIVSEETRQRCREAQLERFKDPKERAKIGRSAKKFWKENPDIKEQMSKNVSKAKEKYNFLQYTREGEFIKNWDSVKSIIYDNPDYKWQNIYSVCNGYKKTYMGFVWKKELKI